MSEKKIFDSNIVLLLAIIAVVTTGWYAFGYDNGTDTQVATIAEVPTEVAPAVATILNDEVVEEVTVYADPNNLPSDEELKTDELVEKAQEAADRNQANEDGKSEDVE